MKKKLLLFYFLLTSTALFSQAVPYTHNYNLTGSPTFNRPIEGTPPPVLSALGTAVRYNVYVFTPSITGSYTFANTFAGAFPNGDSYGFLYTSPFNPASPLTNVLIGKDDGNGGRDYIFTRALTAGVSYTLVSTTFENGETSNTGSTLITGPVGAVLPLKWLQVGGLINTQNKAVISWKVEESQVAWYQVEKSNNGIDFILVSRIASKGDGVNTYDITDANTLSGTSYYRILQQDADGKITYSRVIKLIRAKGMGITIYPNPAVGEQIQVIVGQNLINTTMRLINLNGQVLQNIKIQQSNFTINLNKYVRGIYFLQFEDGKSYKLVVQ